MHTREPDFLERELEPWSAESLDESRIMRLLEAEIPSEEVKGGRCFGVHVFEGMAEAADIARFVEATVFEEHFGNNLNTMRKEYGPYDQHSIFLTVLDYENVRPVGVVRIICPSSKGLKSMHDLVNSSDSPWYRDGDTEESRFAEVGPDKEKTVDISTMAIMPEYRSNHAIAGASASLYSTCVRWSLANDYHQWITIVDKNIFEMMQSWGKPFKAFEGTDFAPYLDSAQSLPVYTELHAGLERIKNFDVEMSGKHGTEFDIHGLYTKGSGLRDNFVLPEF